MNIALRGIGALLIVCGLCLLLISPWSSGHFSYTEPYIKILAHQFELLPAGQEAKADPQSAQNWHNVIAGTLETYARKVSSEQPQEYHLLATALQIIGLAILFFAGRQRCDNCRDSSSS